MHCGKQLENFEFMCKYCTGRRRKNYLKRTCLLSSDPQNNKVSDPPWSPKLKRQTDTEKNANGLTILRKHNFEIISLSLCFNVVSMFESKNE